MGAEREQTTFGFYPSLWQCLSTPAARQAGANLFAPWSPSGLVKPVSKETGADLALPC